MSDSRHFNNEFKNLQILQTTDPIRGQSFFFTVEVLIIVSIKIPF
jgi:hypothetical protein